MSDDLIHVYVQSQPGDTPYLVEVKRYKVFHAARRLARNRPDATTYIRHRQNWYEFFPVFGIKNAGFRRLGPKEIECLPKILGGQDEQAQ